MQSKCQQTLVKQSGQNVRFLFDNDLSQKNQLDLLFPQYRRGNPLWLPGVWLLDIRVGTSLGTT